MDPLGYVQMIFQMLKIRCWTGVESAVKICTFCASCSCKCAKIRDGFRCGLAQFQWANSWLLWFPCLKFRSRNKNSAASILTHRIPILMNWKWKSSGIGTELDTESSQILHPIHTKKQPSEPGLNEYSLAIIFLWKLLGPNYSHIVLNIASKTEKSAF